MRTRGRVVVVEGASGAGKSTVARAAARALGGVFLAEAFDRLDPPPDLNVPTERDLLRVERALVAEERRRFGEAERRRRRGETVVADTGFLGPATYTAGLVALGRARPRALGTVRRLLESPGRTAPSRPPDLVVYLDVPAQERRRRVAADPVGHPPDLQPRHTAVGRVERAFYRDPTVRRLLGRVHFVRADRSPRSLATRIRVLADERGPSSPDPRALARLLDRLDELVTETARRRRVARHR